MRRLLVSSLVISAVGLAAASDAAAAALKAEVAVRADVVRLGDILTGAGGAASTVVAEAPAPGKRLMLSAAHVRVLAERNGVALDPAGAAEKVVVTRASRLIETEEIAAALRKALAGEGIADDSRIELATAARRIRVPVEAGDPVRIEGARYDRRTGRVWATLAVPASGTARESVEVTGRVLTMVEVPVLGRAVRPGERIRKNDIEWIEMPSRTLGRNVVTDAGQLVGRTPRRPLRTGIPVGATDVEAPVVVGKGTFVVLVLESENLTLQAKMQAVEDGTDGQTIRLINPRSKRIVEGVVVGPGRVVVPRPLALPPLASR